MENSDKIRMKSPGLLETFCVKVMFGNNVCVCLKQFGRFTKKNMTNLLECQKKRLKNVGDYRVLAIKKTNKFYCRDLLISNDEIVFEIAVLMLKCPKTSDSEDPM